jgi:hypothetical protein
MNNMKIEIFDDYVDHTTKSNIYACCRHSLFNLGWEDSDEIEKNQYKNLHCTWKIDQLVNSRILPFVKKAFDDSNNFKQYYNLEKLWRCEINFVKPTDIHFIHSHKDKVVALYYVNLNWSDGYYGETLFFEQNLKNVLYTSIFKPGRIILFDGDIPHSIRPQSVIAPRERFTLSLFFDK